MPTVSAGRVLRRSPFARTAVLTAVWTANAVLVAIMIYGFFVSDAGYDWLIYREAGERVFSGDLYAWEGTYAWSYSPLLAYLFAAIAPIGYLGWSVVHVAVLALLRDWWLVGLTFVSFPFWADLYNGNTMTFVFVAAVGALRRNTVLTAAFLVLCLLMPRPVMLPVLAFVLWRQPGWRIWFAGLVVVNVAAVLATGYAGDWIGALTRVPAAVSVSSRDLGPGVLLGALWLPIGLAIAGVLLVRGRIGLASVAASPYWLPQYFIMLLLELIRPEPEPTRVNGRTAGEP